MKKLLLLFTICLALASCGWKTGEKSREGESLGDQKSLAIASLYRKNFRQAIEDIKAAEAIDRSDAEVQLIRGLIYFALKDYKETEASYYRALELKPDYSEARYNLCGLYLTLDKADEAIRECGRAAADAVYPSRDKALTSLGVAYVRKGQNDKALGYFRQSLEINPALVYTHNELGKLYMAAGREEEALDEFRIAIEGYDVYDEAHYNMGIAYLKLKNAPLACASFKRVAEISPASTIGISAKSYLTSLCN
ncbi:MAG: tetratricopeptide repeat protein [Deltaproteobacteria bacterium]